jgi:hypothetical protein
MQREKVRTTSRPVTLPAGKAIAITATESVGGRVLHDLIYYVDAGNGGSWLVLFQGKDGAYAANLATIGKMVSSFTLG